MRWPLMWRSTVDRNEQRRVAALTDAQSTADRLREQNYMLNGRCLAAEGALEHSRLQFDTLLNQFTTLRLRGASNDREGVPALPVTPPPDELALALDLAMQGRSYAVRAQAEQQLAVDRDAIGRGYVTEAEVLARIRRGVAPQTLEHLLDDSR